MTADDTPYTPGPNAFDISPAGDGGVLKEIIRHGEGEYTPNNGCKVTVHYSGTLTDGTKFDSSFDRDEPFSFNLGKSQVIKAWDIGVATMKKGEVSVLTCKPEYAYGKAGSPPKIPPDSTLHFEVEMIDWQKEDLTPHKDGGILRNILQAGEGHATPNDGAMVDVDIICQCKDKVVEERKNLIFNIGEGIESGVPQGVEKALEKFKLKEKSELEIKSKYAWGKEGKPELDIPPHANLVYTVTLNNFEKVKEAWSLDSDGKLEQGKFFKEKGTNYFKSNKIQLALKMYKKSIEYLEFDSGFVDEGEKERKSLLVSSHLNCALCLNKLLQYTEAKEQCNKVLELDPTNEKGLFRRGQANLALGEPEIAKVDFELVLKQDATNKAAIQQLAVCNQKLKEQRAREKQIYTNMFEKFAQKDREEKDSRFGWWTGKSVQVEKMEEVPKDEEDEYTRRLKEKKLFIENMKERKAKLQEDLKARNINIEDENYDTEEITNTVSGNQNNEEKEKNEITTDNQNGDTNEKSEIVQENPKSEMKEKTEIVTEQNPAKGSVDKEEEERKKQPDVMKCLGEWGKDEREREPTEFEKENPNILMLDGTGDFKNM